MVLYISQHVYFALLSFGFVAELYLAVVLQM